MTSPFVVIHVQQALRNHLQFTEWLAVTPEAIARSDTWGYTHVGNVILFAIGQAKLEADALGRARRN